MAHAVERIGMYELVRLIARGGMARVYEARQPALDRTVALKRLDLGSDDPAAADRFVGESRIVASFDHPNIVTVHDYFEHDGVPYIAMEYLPRGSLRAWIGRLTIPQVFGVLEGILAGLAHAEERGVAHRDLKPENVLVTRRGMVKIADFGIAKAYTNVTRRFTATGVALGTPAYMAPEQASGQPIGPHTDLYAVGVMAFEMLAGSPPFTGNESPMAVMYRHIHEAPPPLSDVMPDVDARLAASVAQLLEKDPRDRPHGAAETWRALEGIAVDLLGPYWRHDSPLVDEALSRPDAVDPTRTGLTVALPRPPPELAPVAAAAARGIDDARTGPAGVRDRRRMRRVLVAGGAAAVLVSTAVVAMALRDSGERAAAGPGEGASNAGRVVAPYDFDGDGRATVAAGLPDWNERGAVVLAGSTRAITAASLRVPDRPRAGDEFGAAVASSDFDGDGRADLAVGSPGQRGGAPARRRGAVTVLYGSARGLVDARLTAVDGDGARYGAALAAGDLDQDGYADLVVGAPGREETSPGAIHLLFGGPRGVRRDKSRVLRRPPGAERFGDVLALGDVNRDGRLDVVEAGAFCPGRDEAPTDCVTLRGGIDRRATSLAVGDIDGDRFPDIVQGVIEDRSASAGALVIWRGARERPVTRPLTITQRSPGVRGHEQGDDAFGAAVAVEDVDGDGFADLIIGAPGEDDGAGRVTLLRGGPAGYVTGGGELYSQGTAGVSGPKAPGHAFGTSLAVNDTNGDGRVDLTIAVPGAAGGTGVLVTLPGSAHGFSPVRASHFRLGRVVGPRPSPRDQVVRLGQG